MRLYPLHIILAAGTGALVGWLTLDGSITGVVAGTLVGLLFWALLRHEGNKGH